MAANASSVPADKTQPELWIGNLARGTKSKELQQQLAVCGVEVLRCQIKKPNSRHPYAFVRVATQKDLRTALAANGAVSVGGREVKIKASDRCQNFYITYPTELEIQDLESFSIGVYFLRQEKFFQRWRSGEMAGLQGTVKCTMDFEEEAVHLCFMTTTHQYKVQFAFKNMQFFLYFGGSAGHASGERPPSSYGLVLAFQVAPLVFRQDRNEPSGGGDSDDEFLDEFGELSFLDFNAHMHDERYDDRCEDFFWAAGDLESHLDWRRTTGTFTEDASIQGQYFHYMLTPNSERDFMKIVTRLRHKYDGYEIYSSCPVVEPCNSGDLLGRAAYNRLAKRQPFQLMFLIERLVGAGLLYREMLTELFFDMLASSKQAYRALRHYEAAYCNDLSIYGTVMEEPVEDLCHSIDLVHEKKDVGKSVQDDFKVDCSTGDHAMIYQITVTPLAIYCEGPNLDTPNRVLRHYKDLSDRFLRVRFADENHERLNVGHAEHPLTEILDFIQGTLQNGVDVAGRHYEFLAMSNAQLRENSCWFFASETKPGGVTADRIRTWMGDFSGIKNVAKYAARMGQCFSCTVTSRSLAVSQDEYEEIPDIKTQDGKYTFSDGIGLISPQFAKEAAKSVRNLRGALPSAFQIRFAGYKGMVAVHPGIQPPLKMKLRPSMRKFASQHLQLEIIQPVRFHPGHLNRQIILLLSTLDVPDHVFMKLQRQMTRELDGCFQSEQVAMKVLASQHCLLEINAPTTMLHVMLENGFRLAHGGRAVLAEPFLEAMVLAYRNWRLAQLEEKAHIYVEDAACLQGVLDESAFLDYGEVHVRVRDSEGMLKVITGPVVVAKNPCLHPGDIRVLMAMEVPCEGHSLEFLENCLVFPRQGPRPHPDECSGSDLDGDTYFVSWDPNLIPPKTEAPADYEGKEAKTIEKVELEDVYEFFVNYMQNDSLGKICNSHMALADLSPKGASDERCIELAKLQSDAVDYPKTGVPAKMNKKRHTPPSYPDFMKKTHKTQHFSNKILGQLFREIHQYQASQQHSRSGTSKTSPRRLLIDDHRQYCDADLLVPGYKDFCDEALLCKEDYDSSLKGIMRRFGLLKEEEAVGGFFVKLPRSQRRRNLHDVQTQVRQETTRLRQQYLDEEFEAVPDQFRGGEEEFRRKKASAWYAVTYDPYYAPPSRVHSHTSRGARPELISFPWVAFRYLAAVKQAKRQERATVRSPHLASMQPQQMPSAPAPGQPNSQTSIS